MDLLLVKVTRCKVIPLVMSSHVGKTVYFTTGIHCTR